MSNIHPFPIRKIEYDAASQALVNAFQPLAVQFERTDRDSKFQVWVEFTDTKNWFIHGVEIECLPKKPSGGTWNRVDRSGWLWLYYHDLAMTPAGVRKIELAIVDAIAARAAERRGAFLQAAE